VYCLVLFCLDSSCLALPCLALFCLPALSLCVGLGLSLGLGLDLGLDLSLDLSLGLRLSLALVLVWVLSCADLRFVALSCVDLCLCCAALSHQVLRLVLVSCHGLSWPRLFGCCRAVSRLVLVLSCRDLRWSCLVKDGDVLSKSLALAFVLCTVSVRVWV
jgi:hypothetical protein